MAVFLKLLLLIFYFFAFVKTIYSVMCCCKCSMPGCFESQSEVCGKHGAIDPGVDSCSTGYWQCDVRDRTCFDVRCDSL
ncbi:uncharacterized protein BX664DRAFT_344380 [Halteromyces radiatus]|uniref:uncharacterized protein n=1 Tax=Halteromyces radiatus TaxID=101107 RepID=UPI00221E6010|nr:uncharacterized protein BX664DRAFT_344380 [Halteromyces radiatus]KAI8076321.1 hypothetical protein BX664DRAFT_344380 [Halteromyces radiatus]